ncbi:hypothetical protein HHL09_15120 [Luteolibacter luteus]|uniref:NodB homology domain-containing protein n=2 Tax=Luteolibacter luteus TaxID=2728835 RepID=A0A858RQH1_9BACT|nr:hypothetical protein HHL09_15120 [Luteolibacter luteus]
MVSAYQALAASSPGLLARAYFLVKPFVPRSVRWAVRRSRARGIIRECEAIWPINEAAGATPAGWPGWPNGKDFAVVFTHDVESRGGLAKVRELAEIEIAYGLRSSFNFIPEGSYNDPAEIRKWLEEKGFEIGVHDLNHDGRLYGSREGFRRKAGRINRYLRSWNAVGFRSGFMLRQLDWIHDLDVIYDASTFDTDPFEPQPEGSQTIFPFLVRRGARDGGSGYVELPYTLPQDSTIFLLLGEETPEIWKRKLDWIAGRGGLALVNIHPDYVDFTGRRTSSHYPAAMIREFLDFLCAKYRGQFWNPLAKELAIWYEGAMMTMSREVDSPS